MPMSRAASPLFRSVLVACLAAGVATAIIAQTTGTTGPAPEHNAPISAPASSPSAPATDPVRSAEAFRRFATVLRHPRCMNCHTVTNFPRQGDDRRRHDQLVQRGPHNHGATAMECSACHQNINQRTNGIPGAPGWGLAPLSMGWEGLDDTQLADQLKDPARNGQRSLEAIFDHMAHDELVGWAWKPGGNRQPPPMSREDFTSAVREWIDTGAVSPK